MGQQITDEYRERLNSLYTRLEEADYTGTRLDALCDVEANYTGTRLDALSECLPHFFKDNDKS